VQQADTFEYFATEHFRLSGVYWGVTALALLGRLDAIDGGMQLALMQPSCQANDNLQVVNMTILHRAGTPPKRDIKHPQAVFLGNAATDV
jgi:hypothetical protein